MNKLLIIAACSLAVGYLLYKRKIIEPEQKQAIKISQNKHHLTSVFANAKKHAIHATNKE